MPFLNDTADIEHHIIYFLKRNPAGRGLDFTLNPEHKSDFLRYAVQLQCVNPVKDAARTPLPSIEDLARGVALQLSSVRTPGLQPRQELEVALRATGTLAEWFPPNDDGCVQDMRFNRHLGADGLMTPGRAQDSEGAKTLVVSFRTAAGAVAAISKHRFQIICAKNEDTRRLKVDFQLTEGHRTASLSGQKTILIYTAIPHPLSSLTPEGFTINTNIRDRTAWIQDVLKRLDQFPAVQGPDGDDPPQDMDTEEPYHEPHPGLAQPVQPRQTSAPIGAQQGLPTPAGTNHQGSLVIPGAPAPGRRGPRQALAGSDGDTSPERKAQSAPAPVIPGKKQTANRFAPLADLSDRDEHSEDKIHEGSVSDAASSRSSRPRDFIPITPEILLLLDRLEPDKVKQSRLLTEHINGHRALPTTEEELQQLLEKRTRRALERERALTDAKRIAAEKALAEAEELRKVNELVISDYAAQAREAALNAGKTVEEADAAEAKAAAETRKVVEAATARDPQ